MIGSARARLAGSVTDGTLQSITIVVASKDRASDFARLLASIRAQPTQADRVIVVDQSALPYDITLEPNLLHHYDPTIRGLTNARNVAIEMLETDIVLFLDDDAEFKTDVVAGLRKAFAAKPGAIGFQCVVKTPAERILVETPGIGNQLWRRWEDIFYRGFFDNRLGAINDEGELARVHGCAMSFRTTLFEHERFDSNLVEYSYGEDFEFSKRAVRHGKLYLADSAHVVHHESPANRLKQRRLIIQRWRNMLYFYEKLPEERTPLDPFWRLWWMLGEAIVWLKKGYGLPTDRAPNGPAKR